MELTSKNVETIFMDCLFDEDTKENRGKAIIVDGILGRFGLNPETINAHKKEIISMLEELPPQFKEGSGGGWSFLNACNKANGEQWTGFHKIMEQLVVLGIAIKQVRFVLPRDMWKALPGGMPYFVILKGGKNE